MNLTSPAFKEGGKIPTQYTCQGQNTNPELEISGVPSNAKSLVLILDDPDVPAFVRKEKMWDHWVVFNIPPSTTKISASSQPPGTLGKNTSGKLAYEGPCPPDREHRYFFKLYALDVILPISKGATKADVEKAMQGHILSQAQLMGRYTKTP
ncbi:MAG: YbhB/YbcL family Raf kinase inhibitor-like protein [Candidatus Melainabacteria bacterium]|nr:YbhB/YbcL family Raf kinase inhibitor-like protein [Candidatus Melainabacteria bacterium]